MRRQTLNQSFQNTINLGQFTNRNEIINASGKYIKYLDSDDLIYPHGLEFWFTMEKYPDADYGLCSLETPNNNIPNTSDT